MPRITKVYTRTGDDGTTGLGSTDRVSKASARICAYGTVDELNAHIGVLLAAGVSEAVAAALRTIQNDLFHAGADLCIPEADKAGHPGPQIVARHVEALEHAIDQLGRELQPLENFVLPGGTPMAAYLHVARTVCRRAERDVITLAKTEPVNPEVPRYLNRLSDALFVMSRYENSQAGVDEPLWDSRA